jgi:hypothetical protein
VHGSGLFVSIVKAGRSAYFDFQKFKRPAQRRTGKKTDENAGAAEKDKIMFGPLRKIARAVRGKTVQEREFDYLSDSVSRIDLEFRQREVDRGMFRK